MAKAAEVFSDTEPEAGPGERVSLWRSLCYRSSSKRPDQWQVMHRVAVIRDEPFRAGDCNPDERRSGFTLGHSLTLSLAVLDVVKSNVPVIEALIGFTIALVAAENIGVTATANMGIAVSAGVALAALVPLKMLGHLGLPVITLVGLATFTICYLSLADTQEQAARLRPLLTILFGLIHGFGFASVLMTMRLPTDRLVPALLGFNRGKG